MPLFCFKLYTCKEGNLSLKYIKKFFPMFLSESFFDLCKSQIFFILSKELTFYFIGGIAGNLPVFSSYFVTFTITGGFCMSENTNTATKQTWLDKALTVVRKRM